MRARLFIDFWNFTLQWRGRTDRDCDWSKIPMVLCEHTGHLLKNAQLGEVQLEEARVYASYEPGREQKLKNWLHNFLDRQPGIRVFASERRWKERPIHCRFCNTKHDKCPTCGNPLGRSVEKAVDARIVTDMLSLAWENGYDIAVLVSSDKDFIPAVDCLQAKRFKVINATWKGLGFELARVCWASFDLDELATNLYR